MWYQWFQKWMDFALRLLVKLFPFKTLPLARWYFSLGRTSSLVFRSLYTFTMPLNVSRSDTHRLLFLKGESFVPEGKIYRHLLKPGQVVVDVGANIGYYTLLARRYIGAPGHLLCFEPEPTNVEELESVIRANGFTNVEVFPQAVGDQEGKTQLALGLNGVVQGENQVEGKTVEVPLVTLDGVLNHPVDVIKIDVEGYELPVLWGAKKTIERHKPTLFIEVHPHMSPAREQMADILAFLNEHYSSLRVYELNRTSSWTGKVALAVGLISPIVEVVPAKLAWEREESSQPFWVVVRD